MSEDKTWFVGPATCPWWKFKVGRTIFRLRMRHQRLRHVPGFDDYLTSWALGMVLGSREIERIGGEGE
ncbi:hypothetical protein [Haloferax sulfurifontis]|uniref:Uncharacterized protein n=2 Tax=Haloferax sulfurifontis TaxID=255616 RepID=M0IIP2_9EURY|nr:hypothetical protein [Haloferax sulfurifontis]ELZ96620.1 hypothetical protein C441_04609 [Haloferax sulfurifontis ATCC BAA-897]GGC72409.1 hypothetical protein GCM10007209_37910 [Haloferax sulfurifontis]